MTTFLNGTEFVNAGARTFTPAFESAQTRRDLAKGSLVGRRQARRDRRANRAF